MKKLGLTTILYLSLTASGFSQLSNVPLACLTVANMHSNSYTLYYPNGVIEETGNWKNHRNVGDFKRYYKNGQLAQDFHFTISGKRDGVQKYYHENGKLKIIGKWRNGEAVGLVKVYDRSGKLVEVVDYSDGKLESRYFELITF